MKKNSLVPINLSDAQMQRIRNASQGRTQSGEVAQLRREVQELRSQLTQNRGGQVVGPDRNAGAVMNIRGAQYGHGGIQDSKTETIADGTEFAKGDTLKVGVTGVDLNRIQDNQLCAVEAAVSDQLYNNANDIRVTLTVNGDPVPSFRNVPLRYMIPTLDDEPRFVYPELFLGASDKPQFEVKFVTPLVISGEQSIRFILTAGQC